MSHPAPLPPELINAVFTTRQAAALGVSTGRLTARDLRRISTGIYAHGTAVATGLNLAAALGFVEPRTWLSHLSAAEHHGLYLPPLAPDALVHLSRPRGVARCRVRGVVSHQARHLPGELMCVRDVPGAPAEAVAWVSTPSRTWLELAAALEGDSLVAVGDQLVRVPRSRPGDRRQPLATLNGLRALLELHPNMGGVRRARNALEQVRVGSHSRPESLLRLALVRAGLPEPELQISLDPSAFDAPSADMGYRHKKIVLQYEGSQHREAKQFARDIRRDQAFADHSWATYRYSSEDLRTGFGRAVHEMRALFGLPW